MSHAPIRISDFELRNANLQFAPIWFWPIRNPQFEICSFIGAQGRTQTFNLWFVGPALRQLSYSGGNQFATDEHGSKQIKQKEELGHPHCPLIPIRVNPRLSVAACWWS